MSAGPHLERHDRQKLNKFERPPIERSSENRDFEKPARGRWDQTIERQLMFQAIDELRLFTTINNPAAAGVLREIPATVSWAISRTVSSGPAASRDRRHAGRDVLCRPLAKSIAPNRHIPFPRSRYN